MSAAPSFQPFNVYLDMHGRPSIAIVVFGLYGLLLCMSGYRWFTLCCFTCSFCMGGFITAGIAIYFVDPTKDANTITALFLIGGLVLWLIVHRWKLLCTLVIAATAGLMLAFVVFVSTAYFDKTMLHQSWPLAIMIVGSCVVCMGSAIRWKRVALIPMISWIGAETLVVAIGRFGGQFLHYITMDGNMLIHVDPMWWIYLGGMVVGVSVGTVVQWKWTAKDLDHQDQVDPLRQTKVAAKGEYPFSQPVMTPPFGPSLHTRV